MLRGPSQCPLFMAALVAICGVALIVFSSVWPTGPGGGNSPQRVPQEHLYERYLRALQGISQPGPVTVVDFGDGLGLGVNRRVPAGSVLFSVPESLALDPERSRSCHDAAAVTSPSWPSSAEETCAAEEAIAAEVSKGTLSRLTGMLALLVLARRRSLAEEAEGAGGGSAAAAALAVLPDLSTQEKDGLFAIDEEEFRVFASGTSMEGWQQAAINESAGAHDFLRSRFPSLSAQEDAAASLSLAEVRWAFLALHAHAQWIKDDPADRGTGFPSQTAFLLPLLLARPTPEWRHGVEIRHDPANRAYDVVTPRALRPGDEIHYVDRRMTDASVLCFRGLQLKNRHRARLSLDVSAAPRDPLAQPVLDRYGCGAQPLQLYVHVQKAVDPQFLACMRLLALSANATQVERAVRAGWAKNWPDTGLIDRAGETAATELAIASLQQALARLGGANGEIRQRYGRDVVAARPAMRVRQAETMIVVGLLKAMKELQLVSSSEYLFEALHDEQAQSGLGRQQRV
eukprot:TRINITY_DN22273_c0_g2_i1.p1 TRINITY_DN22273_c0_g2~~TRINITY_DN22273_c0_g2_i1.p1  ORF type:complete len:565 (-),score=129.72 TRINITY_DN22273_c0_g2_i1:108-1652(-)